MRCTCKECVVWVCVLEAHICESFACDYTVIVWPGTRWAATIHPVCKSELKYSTVYLQIIEEHTLWL